MEQTRARASWWRRLATVPAIVLLLVIGVLAFRLAPLFLAPNAYAGVPSIERSRSYQDPALLRVAWGLPVASRYGRYSFEFQSNQSVCGPASVANVLHSLRERSTQEQVLAGSPKQAWFGYLLGCLTPDQLGDLISRRTGRPVRILRGLDLADFRAQMRFVNDPGRRVVANFHRGPLFGRGHGHNSPLLAYLPSRDLVLVGDVNAEYRPFLVSTERFWRAVDTIDPDTGKKRDLAILDLGWATTRSFQGVRLATKRQRPLKNGGLCFPAFPMGIEKRDKPPCRARMACFGTWEHSRRDGERQLSPGAELQSFPGDEAPSELTNTSIPHERFSILDHQI